MTRIGIRFIGVVKTATKTFPMAYLSSIELDEGRGQRVGVVLKSNGTPTMMACVWMDRDRRYFISTASLLQDGKDYPRIRWRQPDLCWKARGPVRTYEPITEYPSVNPSTRRASRLVGIPMGPVSPEALTGGQARSPVYTSYITCYYLLANHAACEPYLLQLTMRQSLVYYPIIYLEQHLQSSSYISL